MDIRQLHANEREKVKKRFAFADKIIDVQRDQIDGRKILRVTYEYNNRKLKAWMKDSCSRIKSNRIRLHLYNS